MVERGRRAQRPKRTIVPGHASCDDSERLVDDLRSLVSEDQVARSVRFGKEVGFAVLDEPLKLGQNAGQRGWTLRQLPGLGLPKVKLSCLKADTKKED
jgi:hypothetical protein